MLEKLKIKEIYSVFNHHDKEYILFSIYDSEFDYLYFTNKNHNIRSLLYGIKLSSFISSLLDDPTVTCIECNLGVLIEGGISLDGDSIVEINLSILKGNQILNALKKRLRNNANIIKFVSF